MVGNNSHTITRRYKGVCSLDHVPVSVIVAGCPKWYFLFVDAQSVGISEIGIRMQTAEIRLGDRILDRRFRQTKLFNKDIPVV
jgi:hypothetical protein